MDAARGIPLFKRDGTLKAGILAGALSAWAATTLTVEATALNRVSGEKTLLLSACRFGALAWRRRPCIWRAYRAGTFRRGAWRVRLPDRLGGQHHLHHLVCPDRALFRRKTIGVHFPSAAFRRGGGSHRAKRTADAGLCAGGSASGRRAPSRQHAPVTLYAYRGLVRRLLRRAGARVVTP